MRMQGLPRVLGLLNIYGGTMDADVAGISWRRSDGRDARLPQIQVPLWARALAAAAVALVYLVALENGAVLGGLSEYVHEFFHDGRHFGAFPCH